MSMTPEKFILSYQKALASQEWSVIDPLISEDATVTFSSRSVHVGKEKVRTAFENNFSLIKGETYEMENIRWLKKEATYAVYIFNYRWSGKMNGELISGSGIGTSVLINESGLWKLLTEHLGRN